MNPGAGWGERAEVDGGGGGGDDLCGVRAGLGRLSFGASGDGDNGDGGQEEEDSRFYLPPAAPAGACGLPDGSDLEGELDGDNGENPAFAAFLPLRTRSRKRKLMRFDRVYGSGGGCVGGGGGGSSERAAADQGCGAVKREIKSEGDVLSAVGRKETAVKQEAVEPMEEAEENSFTGVASSVEGAATTDPWPLFVRNPVSTGTAGATAGDAATSVIIPTLTPPVFATVATVATTSAGLDTAPSGPSSPMTTAAAAARSAISVGSVSGSSNSEFLQGFTDQFLSFESPTASYMLCDQCDDGSGSGNYPDADPAADPATAAAADAGRFVGGDSSSSSRCGGGVEMKEEDPTTDIRGDGTATTVVKEEAAAAVASSWAPAPNSISPPPPRLPKSTGEDLKEGLSALMQNPTFLAALTCKQGSSSRSSHSSSSNIQAAASAAAGPPFSPEHNAGGEDQRPRSRSGVVAAAAAAALVAGNEDGSGASSAAVVTSGGGGGGGSRGGGCLSGRPQGRGFGQRLLRSEEACA